VIARKTSLGDAKFLILLKPDSSREAPFCTSKISIDARRLWSLDRVADPTIRSIEKHNGAAQIAGLAHTREYRTNAREESIKKLADALEKASITFLPETAAGFGLRGKHEG